MNSGLIKAIRVIREIRFRFNFAAIFSSRFFTTAADYMSAQKYSEKEDFLKMKNYIAPKMDIVLLDVENVITTSGDNDFDIGDLF